MDIFTTALTRVVQVPIKPKDLKVKALVKEAATRELEAELDHLESAGSFFIPGYHPEHHPSDEEKQHANKSQGEDNGKPDDDKQIAAQADAANKAIKSKAKPDEKPTDEPPHLDIFV